MKVKDLMTVLLQFNMEQEITISYQGEQRPFSVETIADGVTISVIGATEVVSTPAVTITAPDTVTISAPEPTFSGAANVGSRVSQGMGNPFAGTSWGN